MGYKNQQRSKAPSKAVAVGTVAGTAAGAALDAALQSVALHYGFMLPAGTGAAIAGAFVGLFAYFTKGGRKGEAD